MFKTLLLVLNVGLVLCAPMCVHAQGATAQRVDRFGDPLPVGALARLGTLRFHRCSCAVYSPDGKIIATADGDEINLWDAVTTKRIRQLPSDMRHSAAGLIFSHDGKKLALVGWGGTSVHVWDLNTYNRVKLDQTTGGSGGGDWSNAAAFSSDDKTIYSGTYKTLFAWDVATGKKLNEFPWPGGGRMIAFSEDGKIAATQGDKNVNLCETRTGKLLHKIELLTGGDTMRFSRDGRLLVVPGRGHWMSVFSVDTGQKLHSLAVADQVWSVAFSADGKIMAAASNATRYSSSTDGPQVIQLWDVGNLLAPPAKFQAPGIRFVMISPDAKTLAWGCHDQTLCFMDRAIGKDLRPTPSHVGTIRSLVYLPDGKRIVSASEDGTIRIWDAQTGENLKVLQGHQGEILGLALYPNGKLLASCGRDMTFRLWEIETGKCLAVMQDEGNSVVAAAFSADGKQLASGGYRGLLYLRDPATGKIIEEINSGSVTSLAFSPDGKTLATVGSSSGVLRLFDLGGKKSKEFKLQRGGSGVVYSPDGKLLAVGEDETLRLLDADTLREIKRLPGHYNRRGCVTFSPDGRYLASVSDGWGEVANRSIRVFEVATGTEIYSFKKDLPIYAAAFSPDGSKLAVGGADATALILDLKNLSGQKRRDQLTEQELAMAWDRLDATDAARAYEARADLLHAPKSAVPFLAKHLQPAPAIDAKQVESWIKDLDNINFKVRDKASKELGDLGELLREPMRKALAANLTLETRQRLKSLLVRLEQFTPTQLRYLRAIEILEGIGTPEALKIVEKLSKGNADAVATSASQSVFARILKRTAPLPEIPPARVATAPKGPPLPPPGPVKMDLDGDPMPPGAIARLGTARWRLVNEPRRNVVSPDGKMIAVVNNYSGVEVFDARTGQCMERAKTGFFSWGFDLRMAVAMSADWQKVAGIEAGEKSGSVLVTSERGKPEKKVIEYSRDKESYPVISEEVEAAGSFSSMTMEFLSAVDFSPDGKTLVHGQPAKLG